MKLSLVVPCFNEALNVSLFEQRARDVLGNTGINYEIIFVDDGSKDATLFNLKKIHAARTSAVKVISFSRNFGKESALYAGMEHADGEYICFIDADLQQDPEIAMNMVNILDNSPEVDVVAAYQDRRHEGSVLTFFKKSFYKIINSLSNVDIVADASDFRCFRKSVKDSLLNLSEYHRFSKGLFAWVGYSTQFIPYEAKPRANGKTTWNFFRLLNYATEGIVGFSTAPLRLATYLGGITGIAALFYLVAVILEKIFIGIPTPGYATIIVLILFLASIQLFCIGIIGEYVGRSFEQSKNRPIYIAKEYLK